MSKVSRDLQRAVEKTQDAVFSMMDLNKTWDLPDIELEEALKHAGPRLVQHFETFPYSEIGTMDPFNQKEFVVRAYKLAVIDRFEEDSDSLI